MFLLDQELLSHKTRADAGPSDRKTAKEFCILVGGAHLDSKSQLPAHHFIPHHHQPSSKVERRAIIVGGKKPRDERTNKCPKGSAFIPDTLARCRLGAVPSRLPGRGERVGLCRQADVGRLQLCTHQLQGFGKLLQFLWLGFPCVKRE